MWTWSSFITCLDSPEDVTGNQWYVKVEVTESVFTVSYMGNVPTESIWRGSALPPRLSFPLLHTCHPVLF